MEQSELGVESVQLGAVVRSVTQRHGQDWFEKLWRWHVPKTVYACLTLAGVAEAVNSGSVPWGWLVGLCTWWAAVDGVPRFMLSRRPGSPAWALERVKLTANEKASLREFVRDTKPGRRVSGKSGWTPATGEDLWVLLGKLKFESSLRNAINSEG